MTFYFSYTLGHTYTAATFCSHPIQAAAAATVAAVTNAVEDERAHRRHGLLHGNDPISHAHAAVPHIHSGGRRGAPRAMTVTTQSHSHAHGGVSHTIQKHVRTISDGRSYGQGHVSDHSLGGLGGGKGGPVDVNNGPVYHYHYYYDKKRGGRRGGPRGFGIGGRRGHGDHHGHQGHHGHHGSGRSHGPNFDRFDGPYNGPGQHHGDSRHRGRGGPAFFQPHGGTPYHGLITPYK